MSPLTEAARLLVMATGALVWAFLLLVWGAHWLTRLFETVSYASWRAYNRKRQRKADLAKTSGAKS